MGRDSGGARRDSDGQKEKGAAALQQVPGLTVRVGGNAIRHPLLASISDGDGEDALLSRWPGHKVNDKPLFHILPQTPQVLEGLFSLFTRNHPTQ